LATITRNDNKASGMTRHPQVAVHRTVMVKAFRKAGGKARRFLRKAGF
jgi:hypothetical protein